MFGLFASLAKGVVQGAAVTTATVGTQAIKATAVVGYEASKGTGEALDIGGAGKTILGQAVGALTGAMGHAVEHTSKLSSPTYNMGFDAIDFASLKSLGSKLDFSTWQQNSKETAVAVAEPISKGQTMTLSSSTKDAPTVITGGEHFSAAHATNHGLNSTGVTPSMGGGKLLLG